MSNFAEILNDLTLGKIRVAVKNSNDEWIVDTSIKAAILEAFKIGKLKSVDDYFLDKDTLPPQKFPVEREIRVVPFGSAVRHGAYIAKKVVIMPPAYVNVGAYVDEGTMIDSHALVGSCAQIGKNVHLSAGVQIGGVLEPIGNRPVIIEDNAFIGAGAIIVEGVIVKEGAIIAPNVTLSKGIPVYDCVNQTILPIGAPIPKRAVVVSGTRPLSKNAWAKDLGLCVNCAMIIKYRDEKSDASLTLEEILR